MGAACGNCDNGTQQAQVRQLQLGCSGVVSALIALHDRCSASSATCRCATSATLCCTGKCCCDWSRCSDLRSRFAARRRSAATRGPLPSTSGAIGTRIRITSANRRRHRTASRRAFGASRRRRARVSAARSARVRRRFSTASCDATAAPSIDSITVRRVVVHCCPSHLSPCRTGERTRAAWPDCAPGRWRRCARIRFIALGRCC